MTMQRNFVNRIIDICKENKDKTFITYMKKDDTEEHWTYSDFWKRTEFIAKKMQSKEVRKGERILLLTPVSPYAYVMIAALAMTGAVSVILNPDLPPEELDVLVEQSDIRGIVCDEAIYHTYADKWQERFPVVDIVTGSKFGEKEYQTEETKDMDEDVLSILYSSGTTSEPKGVMISYEGQLVSSELLLRAFGTNNIRHLLVFPLFHVSGFSTFFALLLGGGQIGLLENMDSTKLMKGFQKYHPNTFGMVPRVYETIKNKIEESLSANKMAWKMFGISGSLRKKCHMNIGKILFQKVNRQVFGGQMKYLCVGGGRCSREVSEFFQNLGYDWMNTYASTEMNLPMAATTVRDVYPSDSVGRKDAFPEIQIRIKNPDAGGTGEVLVKSPCHMKGYFRDKKATEAAYEDGYFKTGDLGYYDKDGYLYITGRSKESIHLPNGEKVSPEQLEALYAECIPEGVMSACVGVPVEKAGYDEIVLFLEKKNIQDIERVRAQIQNRARKLGGDYRIDDVRFVSVIPVSSIGKVQRYKLRSLRAEETVKEQKPEDLITLNTFEKIKKIVCSLGVKEEIRDDSVLEDDLGIDSLNLFELCVEIEKEFGVDLTNCISSRLTIEQLCEMAENQGESADNTVDYDVEQYPMKRYKWDGCFLSLFCFLTKVFYRFEVEGVENIPSNGPYIIAANHQSHLDGMWIMAAGREKIKLENFCCMAKQEHLDSRVSRRGLRITGGIPVARGANTSPALKRVLECLKMKKIVLIHPEGTRTPNGRLGSFKLGVERLATEADVVVLPVKIEGAYEIYPKGKRLPHIFRRKGKYVLKIHFFKPEKRRDTEYLRKLLS